MRAFLRACMRVNSLAIPEDFRLWPYPNNYGYRLRWRTEMDARHAAMRSRLAFIPLIACTSFFLHLLYHLESDWVDLVVSALEHNARLPSISPFLSKRQQEYEKLRRGPFPTKWEWKEKLQQQTSISSEWLEYFHQILDLPMVGAFVDVHTSGCLPWIPVFLKAKIPLMLYWGSINNWSIPTTLDHLICTPNSSIINTLISEQRPYPPPPLPTEGHIPREVPTNKPRLHLPRIDGGSLPRPNESLFDFIQRREVYRLKVIASESPTERQSRLQREENARKDRPPGRKGARVYYWDLVEGTRVRTAVGRSNYEDIWERYGSHQRRYDSVADEWEVCTDFDPNDAPDDYGPDSDDDSDCFITVRAHIDEETHHNDGAVSSQAYLARLQSPNKLTHSSIEFHEAIEDVAYHRFGFLKQPFAENRDIVLKSQVWKKVLGLFGYGRRHAVLELDVHIKLQMCQFITRLLDAADLRHAPEVYDLSSRSLMQPPVPFEVDTLTSRNGCYFLIQAKDAKDDEEYVIAFRSAATIMEIARRGWGPRTEDIIKCLIEEGISFNTLMASHPPRRSLSMPFHKPAVLGFRPVGFVPTLQDYCSYELVRNDFLRSARGRSALLAGGIIARLARGIVDVNDVYDGPTGHALNEGEQALCVWEAGQACAFWDDKLTDEEMDLICGSYEVATGSYSFPSNLILIQKSMHLGFISREGKQQTAIKSWWPRSGSWRSCGLNCGYWSSDAEDWFRNRLDQILKSTVPMALMTSQEWHGRLKFQRAHTLSNQNDGFAAEYLKTKQCYIRDVSHHTDYPPHDGSTHESTNKDDCVDNKW
ncbi:hypothetical protein HHX47_DHR1000368 [Lentinula edodes]|nr:hypothetical protein HHX47_DHR1000368 [Lentinula edodes]